MLDWNEVLDLLKKADHHFNLGLTRKNGWIYLPIDGSRLKLSAPILRSCGLTKSDEKKELKLKEWGKTKI